ncbi:unnamed protein product [Cunninghamella blakesleeana]
MKDKKIAVVESVSLLTRSDKRPDRVEIESTQQHLAAIQAEEESKQTGRTRFVIGWYHSHPHITVFPSHIDLQTQYSQQMMDEHFFGIIVSCFDKSENNNHRTQITCFQSQSNDQGVLTQAHIPLEIQPTNSFFPDTIRSLSKIPSLIYEEYVKEFNKYTKAIQYHTDNNEDQSNNYTPKKIDQMTHCINNKHLPNQLNCMYNANIFAQSVIQLVDTSIIPSTYLMNLRAQKIEHEIKQLQQLKEQLLAGNLNDDTSLIDLN